MSDTVESRDDGQPTKKRPRLVVRMIRSALMVYIGVLVLLMIFEEKLIFFPSRYPAGDWEPAGVEDVFLDTSDGVRIHGWYLPKQDSQYAILFFHGNAGDISGRIDDGRRWSKEMNASILMMDYRGYGRSEGKPTEKGLYIDAETSYQWLQRERGWSEKQIIVRGRSLGGGVAVDLASNHRPGAVVLESTFTSLVAMGQRQYPWLPVGMVMRNRFDSAKKIQSFQGPVFIGHGLADNLIPIDLGKKLFDKANEPKLFRASKGVGHNDAPYYYDAGYFGAIREFLAEHMPD